MSNRKKHAQTKAIAIVSLISISCLTIGCANRGGICGVDCCADVPAGAIPEPPGTKVCRWQTEQVRSAFADQTVIYRSHFVAKSDSLSPAARDRISRLSHSGFANVQPWVIEPSGDDDLDARRLMTVNDELSRQGITPTDIQLAKPAALGLRGPQAERIAGGLGRTGASRTGAAPTSRAGSQVGGNLATGTF